MNKFRRIRTDTTRRPEREEGGRWRGVDQRSSVSSLAWKQGELQSRKTRTESAREPGMLQHSWFTISFLPSSPRLYLPLPGSSSGDYKKPGTVRITEGHLLPPRAPLTPIRTPHTGRSSTPSSRSSTREKEWRNWNG